MEEYSNISVWELLKIMQQKVKENAEKIDVNLKSVKIVKNNYSASVKRDKIINSIYLKNTDLTKENSSLLNLHNALYKFYNEFKDLLSKSSELKVDRESEPDESWRKYRDSCMEKSVSGKLQINDKHPFINDGNFLNELMAQCQSMELYERCSEIKKIKSIVKIKN